MTLNAYFRHNVCHSSYQGQNSSVYKRQFFQKGFNIEINLDNYFDKSFMLKKNDIHS